MTIDWICADVTTEPPTAGAYDLVSIQYPALPHTPADDAIRALMDAVAPGGRLLVVGHADVDPEFARAHGFDLHAYVQPSDIAARLGDNWTIEIDGRRPRSTPLPPDSPHTHDIVLAARRR